MIYGCRAIGRRVAVIVSAAAVLVGCGGGSVEPTKTSVAYQLVSIDGIALPITDSTIHSGIITAGNLELIGTDSATSNQTDFEPSVNENPPITEFEVGNFRVSRTGSMLVLEPTYGTLVDTAFMNGNTITLNRHVPFAGVMRIRVYDYVTP